MSHDLVSGSKVTSLAECRPDSERELRKEVANLRAEIKKLKSENLYIVGFYAGWEEAMRRK